MALHASVLQVAIPPVEDRLGVGQHLRPTDGNSSSVCKREHQ